MTDTSRGDEPWLVLTGDSLFVGDAARPDLAVGAAEGAEGLFHSLHRLLELSDGVEVFPGHVAGSLCGKSMCSKPSTTIGFERRFNPTLQITDVGAFIAESAAISAPKPPNLATHRRGEPRPVRRRTARSSAGARRPAAGGAAARRASGAVPTSTGHRPGAINVPVSGIELRDQGGIRARRQRNPSACSPTPPTRRGDAIRGLQSVAFFDIAGYVLGGGDEHTDGVTVDELEELVADGVTVIDVREADERETGFIPGSRNIPYRLVGTADADLPADRPGGHDLRERRPGRDRRQRSSRPWLRRAPRRRRRPRRVAPAWRRDRNRGQRS